MCRGSRTTGADLDAALAGVQAIIDVTNTAARDAAAARKFFTGTPQGRARDLAGPDTQDLVDMARRTLAARGQSVRLVPSWRGGLFGVEMAGEVLLPGPDARLAQTTFDTWLAAEAAPTG